MVSGSRLRIALARLAVVLDLLWERAVPVLFPALLFPALYTAAALFGLWDWLGDPWRMLALAATLALMLYCAIRGARGFAWPSAAQRARRLEQDAHLHGRPLELLGDAPAQAADAQSLRLWTAQQQRAAKALQRLRPRLPRAALARRDRHGLRAAALLLLFAAMVLAGPQAGSRLDDAFALRPLGKPDGGARLEAWISPPDYTRLPPHFLASGTGRDGTDPLQALSGSVLHLHISGAGARPVLRHTLKGKTRRIAFSRTGPGDFTLALKLDQPGLLTLRHPLARRWHIAPVPDQPPKIIFTRNPAGTASDALGFSYAAHDDTGIAAVALQIARSDGSAAPERKPLDLPALNAKTIKDKVVLDLTRHRWAGLAVRLSLIARDGAGQESTSQSVAMTLPQKLFVNPLAKAIAEQRTLLVRTTAPYAPFPKRPPRTAEDARAQPLFAEDNPAERLERAPAPVRRAAALMQASLRAPELYFKDPAVYAGLRYAAGQLRLARRRADLAGLDDELWALAQWVEGGSLADARAALKAAERAFRRALARNAPADELARLMQRYERAVKRYLQALAEDALRHGKMAQNGGGSSLDSSQLQDMLNALKALSETGARGDARKLLQALSALLQNMRMQLAAGAGPGDDPASAAMRKALEELGELTARQRELLDRLFRQNQAAQGQEGSTPAGTGRDQGRNLATEEQALSGRLGALAREQDKAGRSGTAQALQQGAQDMEETAKALRQGKGDEAMDKGKAALSALRQGNEKLAAELFRQMQGQKRAGQTLDPFGRPAGNSVLGGAGVRVPDIINARRARKILQQLRDRAAQRNRPKEELDYLDRLLERF